MLNYPIHTIASAPQGSKSALEQLQKALGVLPNLPQSLQIHRNSSTPL
jgi:hypothetical protein